MVGAGSPRAARYRPLAFSTCRIYFARLGQGSLSRPLGSFQFAPETRRLEYLDNHPEPVLHPAQSRTGRRAALDRAPEGFAGAWRPRGTAVLAGLVRIVWHGVPPFSLIPGPTRDSSGRRWAPAPPRLMPCQKPQLYRDSVKPARSPGRSGHDDNRARQRRRHPDIAMPRRYIPMVASLATGRRAARMEIETRKR